MISPLLDKTLSGVPHADRNLKFIIISKIKLNKIKILNSFIFIKKIIIFPSSGDLQCGRGWKQEETEN